MTFKWQINCVFLVLIHGWRLNVFNLMVPSRLLKRDLKEWFFLFFFIIFSIIFKQYPNNYLCLYWTFFTSVLHQDTIYVGWYKLILFFFHSFWECCTCVLPLLWELKYFQQYGNFVFIMLLGYCTLQNLDRLFLYL